MTKEEWKDIAKIMNALYDDGKLMFEKEDVEKMAAWYSVLQDLDYQGAAKAVRNLAMKSPYKPRVSDIRAEYALITQPEAMNEQEAWEIVADGIRNGYYGSSEEFAKFPPVIQKAVASPSALWEWAQLPSEEVHTVVQSQFKRAYRAELERQSQDAILGAIGTRRGELQALAQSVVMQLEEKE